MMASRSNKYGVLRDYHRWLISLVDDEIGTMAYDYSQLMGFLSDISFKWTMDMDKNRAEDGLQLRYEYDYSFGGRGISVSEELEDVPCSVLEMLVALSLRCYDEFLSGFDEETASPHRVFFDMITNLGLSGERDDRFSFDFCLKKCNKFLKREYQRDGYGNIFRVNPKDLDCRDTEIWWQMMRYVDGYF